MKKTILITSILFVILAIIVLSCNRNKCFDKAFYLQHKNDSCTEDCPGVIGCDGKEYCNECIANAYGIRVR